MKYHTRFILLFNAAILGGCALGPDYVRPALDVPSAYKEAEGFPGWKAAEPQDHQPGEEWWKAFADARLDALQQQAAAANQNIRIAEANYRESQALSALARASFFPTITGTAASTRTQRSGNTNNGLPRNLGITKSNSVELSASWEIDLWGRIRRGVESGDASLAASAGDVAAAILSVQASLAQSYFQLRILDTQQKLLDDTAAAYQRSLTLTANRHAVGLASRADVAQAEGQLSGARAQAIDIRMQRSQLEHAIAVLTGQAPAQFSLAAMPLEESWANRLPKIPVDLPSELLERRPDIAAAERRVAAANAGIGVAKSAFFPVLNLNATGGYQSSRFAELVSSPSRAWSLGPQLALSLFDGGARRARTDAAVAAHDASAASYKSAVLTAFQEVEDNLVAIRLLEQEAAEQDAAVRFARESVQQTLNRYKAGTVDYLSVATVQATALADERAALALLGRRLAAQVGLVKALGGNGFATIETDNQTNGRK